MAKIYLPISDEPIDEGDLWWARHVTPLVARLASAHPDLFPTIGADDSLGDAPAREPVLKVEEGE